MRYSVQAGSTQRTYDDKAQRRIIVRFLRHPDFIPGRWKNDISIMFWRDPLTFGSTIRAIALPTLNHPVPVGPNATVTGWGDIRLNGPFSKVLKVVTEPLISNEECSALGQGVTPGVVCTGGQAGGAACTQDAGSPVVYDDLLVGIVSWDQACGKKGDPTVNTRVAYFIDWIKQYL